MAINKITATEGNWLFNGEGFAKEVSGFGDLSKWSEVTDDYKTQWEAEHANPEIPEIGGDNVSSEPELLCDLTTTEYAIQAVWTQGDNGQKFDDYKEIYIKMLLQPTENSVLGFNIAISNNLVAWRGKYGGIRSEGSIYPSALKGEKTILDFVHLRKTFDGIEQSIRGSFNNSSVSERMAPMIDSICINSRFKNGQINPPEVLEDVSFISHFECIKIGSHVDNMPPNCRFMIYGIK